MYSKKKKIQNTNSKTHDMYILVVGTHVFVYKYIIRIILYIPIHKSDILGKWRKRDAQGRQVIANYC